MSIPFQPTIPADANYHTSRSQRLLGIVRLLQTGGTWNCGQLARQFEVSGRTIFRDLQELRDQKFDVEFDELCGGYRLAIRAKCDCPKLEAEELAALVAALRHAHRLPESILRPCETLVGKLFASASRQVRDAAMRAFESEREERIA